MNKLYYSPEAMSDLDEIWNYINKDLLNPAAARNTVEGIINAIDKLKEFSEIGPSLTMITEFESDYRFLVCGNYLAFYRVTESDVSIDRILYGGRDYLRILFGDPSEYETE